MVRLILPVASPQIPNAWWTVRLKPVPPGRRRQLCISLRQDTGFFTPGSFWSPSTRSSSVPRWTWVVSTSNFVPCHVRCWQIRQAMGEGDWFTTINLKDAYFQIPIWLGHWWFLILKGHCWFSNSPCTSYYWLPWWGVSESAARKANWHAWWRWSAQRVGKPAGHHPALPGLYRRVPGRVGHGLGWEGFMEPTLGRRGESVCSENWGYLCNPGVLFSMGSFPRTCSPKPYNIL